MRKAFPLFILANLILLSACPTVDSNLPEVRSYPDVDHPVKYTGLRSSSYGIDPFPHEEAWEHAFDKMQSYFPESEPCGIWIIADIDESRGVATLEFPQNPDDPTEYRHIDFYDYDKHEIYLDHFDANGIKVFLQVESGYADMAELIKLTLDQYGHHPSVVGFGVDLEWYNPDQEPGSMNGDDFITPLDTATAMEWDRLIKSYNPDYRLFLKHWLYDSSIMPQETASDIIFISDAQDFENIANHDYNAAIDVMLQNFDDWAQHFRRDGYIRSVGYQIGYDSDRGFWQDLFAEPHAKTYCNAILARIPQEQEVSFFWVDFTLEDVFLQDYSGPEPHVIVLPPRPVDLPELGENFALNAAVSVSSVEDGQLSLGAEMLNDNDLNTRWASAENDEEWFELALAEDVNIKTLALFWETAYAVEYDVQLSDDGTNWTTVYEQIDGSGGNDFIPLNHRASFIRLRTHRRATEWGNSLYEVAVYAVELN